MTSKPAIFDAWAEFCERLKDAGSSILRPEVPATDLERAEGFRYLTRLLRAGLERSVEFADPDFPVFYALSHETIKIGSDNPDNCYRNAVISGRRTYRLCGRLGSSRLLSFGTKADGLSSDGQIISTGELSLSDMEISEDGSFEVILSAESQPGNWLPMTQDSSMLLVRETHGSREGRAPASLTIESVEGLATPEPLRLADLATALKNVSAFVNVTASIFADWMAQFQLRPNDWTIIDQREWQRIGGDPRIFYIWGYWKLEEDEVLVIETEVPRCEYWNVQINNYWDESLDFRYFQIHHNNETVQYRDDGSVQIILSRRDLGAANGLETGGHSLGAFMWRWVGASEHPIPLCRVMRIDELAMDLPG